VLGEDQFGFRRVKGTMDAIGMLRIISERTLKIDAELCACFIDWQKAFDRVNWTKLILHYKCIRPIKRTVELGCHERRNVVLTEEYNVVVQSEELTGTTEHLMQ
jgi:hypothetical protein